jgi:hypothetical protein
MEVHPPATVYTRTFFSSTAPIAAEYHDLCTAFSPVKQKLIMPQVTLQPLPVLQEGEGLQEGNAHHNNKDVTINILSDNESWMVVRCKKLKKDSKSDDWTKQQKQKYECFSDIWYEYPYKNYYVIDADPPVAILPQEQQVQPQQQQEQQPLLPPPAPPQLLPLVHMAVQPQPGLLPAQP